MNGIVRTANQPLTTRDFHSVASKAGKNEMPTVREDKQGNITLKNEKLGIVGIVMRKLGTCSYTKDWGFVLHYNKELDTNIERNLEHLSKALKNTFTPARSLDFLRMRENGAVLSKDESASEKLKAQFKSSDFQKNLILNLTTTAMEYEKVHIRPGKTDVKAANVNNANALLKAIN